MSSIIEGYNYDIFISYRQKDNKGDRWVSEFVEALKTELESTFKEDISVYFDINPHDGLLETHDVDASLKEKLKCLIFIPIISRTYCDPKSFAWEHEFKAYVELASQDQFGLKVKLPNGNVANRVLPVRIHDLDSDDIKLCESVLGGVLRGIEFIYKSSGVNRPLRLLEEKSNDNLNLTIYRDQINKVALAIKEIVIGLMTEPSEGPREKPQQRKTIEKVIGEEKISVLEKPPGSTRQKILYALLITVVLVIAAILAYPKIVKRNALDKLRSSGGKISVAVMPFQNNTNDSLLNVWQDGIQEILITSLSNSKDLKVQQTKLISSYLKSKLLTSYASITPSVASTISKKLDANVLIFGDIKQEGSILRLNAQLIDSKTEEVIKSFQIDGISDKIMQNIDSLSVMIRNYLIISKLVKGEPPVVSSSWQPLTKSPEAYRYHLYGANAYANGDLVTAKNWFLKSLEIDSTFFIPALQLSATYWGLGMFDQSKFWCLKIYKNRNDLNIIDQLRTNFMYSKCFGTDFEAIKYLTQLTELDKYDVIDLDLLGLNYIYIFQYNKAITELERSLEIYDEWDSKPYWFSTYTLLGLAYHKRGQYKKEERLYKKAELDFPDNLSIIYQQSILSLTEKDTIAANQYIKKYISLLKDRSASEAVIDVNLASIYYEAGVLDKADEYIRQALSLEPENHEFINFLAALLIEKDRNVNEGLELSDRALKLSPENYEYLDTKGWGLYKQGKYKEAFEILQRSWDLRRKEAVYDYGAYLHLEAAKKAVASQKIN